MFDIASLLYCIHSTGRSHIGNWQGILKRWKLTSESRDKHIPNFASKTAAAAEGGFKPVTFWIQGTRPSPVHLVQVNERDIHLRVETSARPDHVQLNAVALARLKFIFAQQTRLKMRYFRRTCAHLKTALFLLPPKKISVCLGP